MRLQSVGFWARARTLQDPLSPPPPVRPVPRTRWAWGLKVGPEAARKASVGSAFWLNSVKLGESRRLTAASIKNTLGTQRAGRGHLGPPPAEGVDSAAVLSPAGPEAPPPTPSAGLLEPPGPCRRAFAASLAVGVGCELG